MHATTREDEIQGHRRVAGYISMARGKLWVTGQQCTLCESPVSALQVELCSASMLPVCSECHGTWSGYLERQHNQIIIRFNFFRGRFEALRRVTAVAYCSSPSHFLKSSPPDHNAYSESVFCLAEFSVRQC